MKLFHIIALGLSTTLGLFACNNESPEKTTPDTDKPTEKPAPAVQKMCFMKAVDQDSTFVSLEISQDSIHGTMHWQPFEKDGAYGTLTGKKNAQQEFELVYDYTIEGNQQSETKIMKIENGKLLIKVGELVDPANNGHMQYADVNAAVYSDTLTTVPCTE